MVLNYLNFPLYDVTVGSLSSFRFHPPKTTFCSLFFKCSNVIQQKRNENLYISGCGDYGYKIIVRQALKVPKWTKILCVMTLNQYVLVGSCNLLFAESTGFKLPTSVVECVAPKCLRGSYRSQYLHGFNLSEGMGCMLAAIFIEL